tara:strand:+ start:655 stop:951 length:297 start_codon:yes stop_codon:yes gene_type:complete
VEFKRFKRKGLIFNNNSNGIGLEVKLGKKLKVFRIERSSKKEDNTFDFSIFDGLKVVDGATKNEIVAFLEKNNSEYSFFDGELKLWEKIKSPISRSKS